jgi:hypothetical protein
VIACFGQLHENFGSNPHFGPLYALILTKKGLGYILGEFFTNPSAHPDPTPHFVKCFFPNDFSFYFLLPIKTTLVSTTARVQHGP